jgi:D-lactate dehydrogenase
LGLPVVRVPAYSPYAVAEHAVGMILTLNRKYHKAYNRVREGNFALDGLLGFDLHGRTAGVIGTGKIGEIVVRILRGFGCEVLCYDMRANPACEQLGARYLELMDLFCYSDIITLHCPLTPATHHLIDEDALRRMKRGVMLINTSRGALIDARAAIAALKSRHLGYLGLDVYEEEADLFFEDLSGEVIQDDVFTRLLSFPNVLVTGHQAFFTRNALEQIAKVTIESLTAFDEGRALVNQVRLEQVKAV